MASECIPMHALGCGLSQGQGHLLIHFSNAQHKALCPRLLTCTHFLVHNRCYTGWKVGQLTTSEVIWTHQRSIRPQQRFTVSYLWYPALQQSNGNRTVSSENCKH